jgi:hypothetical protein
MPHETHLDQARRHLAQAEELVLAQRELIGRMKAIGQDTSLAEKLLWTFEETLKLMQMHLAQEEEAAKAIGIVDRMS